MNDSTTINMLLVEDSRFDAELVKLHLASSAAHYDVTHAETLSTALGCLAIDFDVVVLDLNLPDSMGLNTLDAVRRHTRTMPIVILSNHDDEAHALQAVRSGAQDYLRKSELGSSLLSRTIMHAIERSRLHRAETELTIAADAQRSLLPSTFPQVEGIDIAGRCDPIDWAGGDYFDFVYRENHLWMLVADVCGHGVGAAMLTAEVRGVVQTLIQTNPDADPGTLLTLVNRVLKHLAGCSFVVMFLAKLDVDQRTLRYASAGHPGYLVDVAGRSQPLESQDPPVGVVSDHQYHSQQEQVHAGQFIVCYTDGICESYNRREGHFGDTRPIKTLAAHRTKPSETMIAELFDAALAFNQNGAAQDDMAAIVVKID